MESGLIHQWDSALASDGDISRYLYSHSGFTDQHNLEAAPSRGGNHEKTKTDEGDKQHRF